MLKNKLLPLILILSGIIIYTAKSLYFTTVIARPENIKTLTLHIPDDLDATKTISYNSILLIDNLFPRLFRINENLQFEGEIAKSWKVDQIKKIIYVTIDKTAVFSDGSPISTDDIAISINKVISPDSLPGFFFKNIKSVKVINNEQVAVYYLGWEVAVLNQLGSPFLPIYKSGEAPYKNNQKSWVVSSRYNIKTWNSNELLLSVHGKTVKSLSVLPLEKVKDSLSSLDLMISRLNWISTDTIRKQINDEFTTYVFDSFNTSVLMSNIKLEPQYRKCLAIKSFEDKELDVLLGDSRIKSILPPSMFSYDPNIKLAPSSKPTQHRSLKLLVQQPDVLVLNIINRLKSVAANCNITLEIDSSDNTAYVNKLLKHDFDFAYVTISILYNDPFFIFSFFHKDSRFNFVGSNDQLSTLINSYPESQTQQETLLKSKILQRKIMAEGLAIPLLTVKSMSFVRKPFSLKGHSLFDVTRWEDIL